MDDEFKIKFEKSNLNFEKLKKGLDSFRKRFKYVLFGIKILGNLAIIYYVLKKNWFNAFILYVIFFPQEVTIVRFFKKLLSKSPDSLENKH